MKPFTSIIVLCSIFTTILCGPDANLTAPPTSQQFLQGDFKPPQVFKNVNLLRSTNLEKSYVRETINVVIENVDKQPQSEYYLPFPYETMGKVGGLEVRDKKNVEKGKFRIEEAVLEDALVTEQPSSSTTQYFIVHLPEPLQPSAQMTLGISYHILSALNPLPASIKQDDKQYLTYAFSAYVPSAYLTLKQKTKLKFPSTDVPDYTMTTGLTSSTDPERQGSTYTYGPYDTAKVPPGTTHPATVRYEFTKPVLACSLVERDIEISHWGGNLASEERYWLRNDGATLLNNFNRVTWASQNHYNSPSSALRELVIPLKSGSADPYFTDDIGNVSTSKFRPNSRGDAILALKPRYPVFGGWKYSFKIGWNNDLGSSLRKLSASDTYLLKVPLIEGPKMPEGIQYERLEVRVILPEGAQNVRHEVSGGSGLPTHMHHDLSLHRTFMDTLGRSELKLIALNVVDEARDGQLIVTYDYPRLAGFRKPVVVFLGILSIFATAWAIGSLDVSIGKKRG